MMLVELESVLMLVIVYITGLASVMVFNKYRYSASSSITGLEERLGRYEDFMTDIRIKLDLLELRSSGYHASRSSHENRDDGDNNTFNHMPKMIRRNLEQEGKGLVDYVLKVLVEGPRTSRQIENVIGRSREHTARLMKKLFELGYVSRDKGGKPYSYTITEDGKNILSEVAGVDTNA